MSYNFSLTTFLKKGELGQIGNALAAVRKGHTSVGIRGKNTVVIATKISDESALVDNDSLEHVAIICDNIGMVYSGLSPDFRVLVAKARKIAQEYKLDMGEYPPATILVKKIASVCQEFTQMGGVRPFGVSILIAGFDDGKPSLYQVDPSGLYFRWKATAIGKHYEKTKEFLERRQDALIPKYPSRVVKTIIHTEETTEADDIGTIISALKECSDGEVTENSLSIGVLNFSPPNQNFNTSTVPVPSFKRLSKSEIREHLALLA
ncbi:Proteasome subunit alpha type-2 [Mycoemilia scoparia]|uniref:Proteasome subunit alpha type-2 n=1 Tax=Mycoemilia scoparia TaxID=417184 RepID=A0A9W8A9C3_9FUNG|nr:Proteasome subunit alpha type-2 [Mycoemilia scoparia]